ncbi:hypothetical protein LDO26_07655 [Luteimonas sp. BDR2-5]|uniref:hypothetical protein n=1 Tax=Proluteimonas luteida TaxID=2878685 RepID=UPI001E3BE2EE|nr:hypothetical protein [Luteimonas sp. BDR2-5]MCD9028082.1 hypothetical protein [Luteimonas sp. BDR2-5]
MRLYRRGRTGLPSIAGLAPWRLRAGSGRLSGVDIGTTATVPPVGIARASRVALPAMPTGEFERGVSPGDWRMRFGAGSTR